LLSTFKKEFILESFMLNKPYDSLKIGQFRLLNCTAKLSLPTNQYIKFFITSTDVIHSFSVPSLFLKVDACPGKLNEFASLFSREGIFYGQCSEICGTNHSFMPIMLEGVSCELFFNNLWFLEQQPTTVVYDENLCELLHDSKTFNELFI
jgi:heme/copper-type cytochrome/quinol oxidase subunit 2